MWPVTQRSNFDLTNVEAITQALRRALATPDLRAELRERGLARAAFCHRRRFSRRADSADSQRFRATGYSIVRVDFRSSVTDCRFDAIIRLL